MQKGSATKNEQRYNSRIEKHKNITISKRVFYWWFLCVLRLHETKTSIQCMWCVDEYIHNPHPVCAIDTMQWIKQYDFDIVFLHFAHMWRNTCRTLFQNAYIDMYFVLYFIHLSRDIVLMADWGVREVFFGWNSSLLFWSRSIYLT